MNQRDLELLSSYLDGQLKPSDSARLETRLTSDPNLRSVLDDLRAARGLLRQLPMRKAPRNFTLTPQMVGRKPPLPRAYPAFRFVTALSTLLFFVTMGVNFLVPQMASQPQGFFGKGGGGAPEINAAQAPAAAATEAPLAAAEASAATQVATEAAAMPAPAATQLPATQAPAEAPSTGLVPAPTTTPVIGSISVSTAMPPSAEDTARAAAETPSEKTAPGEALPDENQFQAPNVPPRPEVKPPVPPVWEILLAGIAVLGAVVMLLMRRLAVERWRRKKV
jgi:anti-sigma factor RsiW